MGIVVRTLIAASLLLVGCVTPVMIPPQTEVQGYKAMIVPSNITFYQWAPAVVECNTVRSSDVASTKFSECLPVTISAGGEFWGYAYLGFHGFYWYGLAVESKALCEFFREHDRSQHIASACTPVSIMGLLDATTSSSAQITSTDITAEIKQRVERCVTRAQEEGGSSGFDAYLTNVYHRRVQSDLRYVEVWLKGRGPDQGWFSFDKCVRETFKNVQRTRRWLDGSSYSFLAVDPVDSRGPRGK